MRHPGDAPRAHPDRETAAQSNAVDEPAGAEERHRGTELERRRHMAVIAIGPAELLFKQGLEQRDDLPIDIIEHDGDERQPDDKPLSDADPLRHDPLRSPAV